MTIPSISSVLGDNRQLREIHKRNLSASDEAAYKASLIAEYKVAIREASSRPNLQFVQQLNEELAALQSMTNEQLANFTKRGQGDARL